jgi:type IV pilus assembly protein PilA
MLDVEETMGHGALTEKREIVMKTPKNAGFTLIELMIVVAIIGVLAVLAIFGVSKYLRNAKTAEATNTLGSINQDAVQAYSKERTTAATAVGLAAGVNNVGCPSSNAIPAAVPANKKYTADPNADYNTNAGWTCLQFSMNQPQYFQYQYTLASATATNAPLAVFGGDATGWAVGAVADFIGDGSGNVQFATGANIVKNVPITATSIASWDVKSGGPL